jgi:hypothetical protein
MIMMRINCTSYWGDGICTHQAAPRRLLGPARCIVWRDQMRRSRDPRIVPGCALCTPHQRPQTGPYIPQAGTVSGLPDCGLQSDH